MKITSVERLQKKLLYVGLGALLFTVLLAVFNVKQFAHSWLFSFMYFYTISVGGIFWVVLQHSTNSGWGVVVRRQMENIAINIFWVMLFFVPILFVLPQLYKWVIPANVVSDPLYQWKKGYLNLPFFYLRIAFYFISLGTIAFFFRKNSIRQDESGCPTLTVKMQKRSFVALPFFAVCLTFSAIDWLMGLDFHWFSTMWGVYIFAGSAQASMALLILIFIFLRKMGYLEDRVNKEHFHLMGKLLFAFTVFWAYIAFSQYMLIWYANIPEETEFLIHRNQGSWYYYNLVLIAGHFVLPFIYLLFQFTKRSVLWIGIISAWVLLMHGMDLYWVVLPQIYTQGVSLHLMDITAWLTLASFFLYFLIRNICGTPLVPEKDPRLEESLKVSN